MAKTCSDGEETSVFIEEPRFPLHEHRPSNCAQLLAPGLSAARRDYLRDNVRPLLSARGHEGFACRVRKM
ncbi:hypothetical protein DPMN_143650 [Dreissena polymorpha]|uniref:Uncharacterized protein n=2 Tax=Dreissena polymorpha TaxID=45954 RepID=A0A9D4GGN9_DREPO|nr:hypothetical protein DPMN_143650 [Dreissena polymorpha]